MKITNPKFNRSMRSTYATIIVEETFKTSIENVWNAITDLNKMKKWYFKQIGSFKAEEGFETCKRESSYFVLEGIAE